MPTMRALIRKRLLESKQVADKLSSYCCRPAVFYQSAPDDKDEAWSQEAVYPYIILYADTRQEAEQGMAGQLSVDIVCNETGVMPEVIEPVVKESLTNVFFTADGQDPAVLVWKESQVFKEQVSDKQSMLVGITMLFDIHDFPDMETGDPDPVAAFNDYAEEWDKDVAVIGRSEIEPIFNPSRARPAFYFRQANTSIDRQTNTVVWVNTAVSGHFFAPTLHDRNMWIDQFVQSLALAGEIEMPDGSPMFIRNIRGNSGNDGLTGQIQIEAQYGILRRPKYAHPMTGSLWEVNK